MINVQITFYQFNYCLSIIHIRTNNYTFHCCFISISDNRSGLHEQVVATESQTNEMSSFAKLRKLLVF